MAEGCQSPEERERYLVRYFASRQLIDYFEKTWTNILGSQIDALEALNAGALRSEVVREHYELAAAVFSADYAHFSFEQWLSFLTSQDLVATGAGNVYSISLAGREFLKYIISSGRSRSQKIH